MSLSSAKLEYLNKNTQFILFSEDGKIKDSCESLFSVSSETDTIYEIFPLIESVRDGLEQLHNGEQMSLPCINTDYKDVSGVYDYLFIRQADDIMWIITDFTRQYHDLIEVQQVRNEFLISGEALEVLNKKTELEKELSLLKKNEKKRIKKFKRKFISKLNNKINTPLNGLLSAAKHISEGHQELENHNSKLLNNAEQLKSITNRLLKSKKKG